MITTFRQKKRNIIKFSLFRNKKQIRYKQNSGIGNQQKTMHCHLYIRKNNSLYFAKKNKATATIQITTYQFITILIYHKINI